MPLGGYYRPLYRETRQFLQFSILRFRWCTTKRIRRQLPTLLRLIIRRHWSTSLAGVTMEETERIAMENYLSDLEAGIIEEEHLQNGNKSIEGGQLRRMNGYYHTGTFKSSRKFENPDSDDEFFTVNSWFLTIKPFKSVTITDTPRADFFTIDIIDGSNSYEYTRTYTNLGITIMPSYLIQGSLPSSLRVEDKAEDYQAFSDERIDLIQILCESGGLIPAYQMTPEAARHFYIRPDALQYGIHAAIVTRNPRALSFLLRLDESICRSRNKGSERYLHYDEGEKNEFGTGKSLRRFHVIPGAHFRTAIRTSQYKHEQSPQTEIFRILLETNPQSLPLNDPEIIEYALRVGGEFGKWLLEFMVVLPRLVRIHKVSSSVLLPKFWESPFPHRGLPRYRLDIMRRYTWVMEDLDGITSPFPRPIDAVASNNKMKEQLLDKWRTIKFCSILLTRNIKSKYKRVGGRTLRGEEKKASLDIYPHYWSLTAASLKTAIPSEDCIRYAVVDGDQTSDMS